MLLTIDIGNTNIKYGVFNGENLVIYLPKSFPERYTLVGSACYYIFNNKSHEH